MRNKIITCLLIFFSATVLAQKPELDIHGRKLSYFTALESKLKSEVYTPGGHYKANTDFPLPVAFKRKQKDLPDLLVFYFCTKDSVINSIIYECDAGEIYKERLFKDKPVPPVIPALVALYRELYQQVRHKYGESDGRDVKGLEKVNLTAASRSDTWLPDDHSRITMYLALSNKFEKVGGVTIPPTNSVKLFVYSFW